MIRWTFVTFASISLLLALGALARADNCYGTGAVNTVKIHKVIPLKNLKNMTSLDSDKLQLRTCAEFIKSFSYFSQLEFVELRPLICEGSVCETTADCTGFIGCP